ncbi:Ppx/GppA phosphatase family protein [Vaginella massiliensis]|uniref:Ppx/GppA phosphatase family protein n=1 Tax=Vaginella massiliensis TaxID=1816680 RepID=UPI000838FD4F|nr:exopolyphosphatase [Vaginella massiliensis]
MKIKKLAAIDIGSNAIRLLINYVYEETNNPPVFNKTALVRMPIRLGQDVFNNSKISDKNIDRIVDAMQAYSLMMKVYEVEHYRACATSAMRETKNGQKVINKIKKKANIAIEVIDGKTEAEMLFCAGLNKFLTEDKAFLYVDVGGGSTELTYLKNKQVQASQSFAVGTVRLLEHKEASDVFPSMQKWIKDTIEEEEIELIGAGGNINHVYKYSGVKLGLPMSVSYLNRHNKILLKLNPEERMTQFNMKPDRADVVVYALEIYNKVAKWSNAKKIHVPKIGLSDGIIRSLYEEVR